MARLRQLSPYRNRVILLLSILVLSLSVRALTANFIRAHFNDSAWFQFGSYAVFDRQAQAVLDGKESFFWINDSSRTDLIQYPPGYGLWVAVAYQISGSRTPAVVQRVQFVLDALSVFLLIGIGVAAFGWPTGIVGGFLTALSPLLALAGSTPNADAPTSWFVLAGVWMLIVSFKRSSIGWALGSGFMAGLACWLRVNPFLLAVVWGVALVLLGRGLFRKRLWPGIATVLAAALTISPVVVRNLVVFYPEVVPNGLSIGSNLWQGIGETSRGREFGAPGSDDELLAQERQEMGVAEDAPLQPFWPEGIRRDRVRTQKSLAVIRSHPFWFAGMMMKRMWGHLKFAGSPAPHVGSMGINVTPQKCLPPNRQHGPLALLVTALGMSQSVLRYLQLPLILIGIAVAWRTNWRITALVLTTILYYLLTLGVGHSEIRYGLPMQALLLLFASVAIRWLSMALRNQFSPQPSFSAQQGADSAKGD